MTNPSKILDGGIEYSLGHFDGKIIHYDFKKILAFLNVKGKRLFGEHFIIYEQDHHIIYKLCSYFIRDLAYCKKENIDTEKGLLLSGPVGCGKTSLMKLLPLLVPLRRPYKFKPSRSVVFEFNRSGYSIIEKYGNAHFYCFDDLGIEPIGQYYGRDVNVMGEILLSRYDLFLQTNRKLKTYVTTNLNAQELKKRYGSRVRSRMREMFNLIAFEKKAEDKRK